ncbi:MAG TPA: 4Fe-4S ferredoxin [Anaerolineaceae bacterium]|uniref:Putative 2-oxoglutarate ferredoxin oxidoreductase delta subunit n=1 Tax=Anaerolinea thermophila TaxID=167964 RepID=A0A101FY04_9CHLR|nr:MAG: Putative 2-oxoglutarate ferredoxin oxidoreductase delta subunit [Anaerolinea thermophila]HAF61056.1 4Fe-4S ferredoxin [Anaerolineaceae bacterium]
MPLSGTIVVDENLCKACELCIVNCPVQVIALDMEHITPRGFHPATLVKEGCTGCGTCAVVCPEAAITVYREKRAEKERA